MIRLLAILAVLLLPIPVQAYNTLGECNAACAQLFPTTGTQPMPATQITFDNTSDQGPVKGVACILFGAELEGKITSVTMNGETAVKGNSYKGRPTFYFAKPGSQYTRPLNFLVRATTGNYTFTAASDSGQTGGGTTGPSRAILWKPVAESGGDLVVLLPAGSGTPAVAVTNMNGTVIETGDFKYLSNPNRPTYRFNRPGRNFPSPCLLKVGDTYYFVKSPANRAESLPSYKI